MVPMPDPTPESNAPTRLRRGRRSVLGRWGASLAFSALVALAGGCKERGEGDQDGVVLRLWAMPNTSRPQGDLEAILQRFEQANPGIRVAVEILDWGSAWTKITNAANAGSGPDLVQLGTTWCASITDMGALLPLNDVVAKVGGDTVFVSPVRPYMQPIYADNVTSLPWFIDVRPLYLRKDVLDSLHISVASMSKSWDSYTAGLARIRDARLTIDDSKVEPLGLPARNDWNVVHNVYPWIVGNGGDIVNDLGDSVLLDSEKSIQGVLRLLGLIQQGLAPKAYLEKNTAQVSAEFDQGRIASWQETTSKLIYLERPVELGGVSNSTAAKNFVTALPPAGPAGRKLFIGGSNLAIFNSSAHKEEARKLLAFMTTDAQAVREFCQASGMAPALHSAYDDPYFSQDPNRSLFRELVAAGKPYPAVPYWGALETTILNSRLSSIFDLVAQSDAPVSEAAVRQELVEAAAQARELIEVQLTSRPQYAERLQRLRALRGSP
ncbi:MAG: extracellular solute-binding protein [Fibrobacteria bacterium]|nr:extracellular solute-binding protein [Fibrobacteria bacterium]